MEISCAGGSWTETYRGEYIESILFRMSEPRKQEPAQVGATIPDVLLRILASPYLVAPLLLLLAGLILTVALGYIAVSWGDGGIKVSQGERSGDSNDLNIEGTWRGTGKDLSDSDHNLVAKYTYTMSFNFVQKGSHVKMHSTYFVNENRDLPERTITGEGTMHGDYLSVLIDIEAGKPVVAKTHGTMIFQFHPSAQTASGYYTDRSMANDGFVFGSLTLSR
jgi:hypothetical protein